MRGMVGAGAGAGLARLSGALDVCLPSVDDGACELGDCGVFVVAKFGDCYSNFCLLFARRVRSC